MLLFGNQFMPAIEHRFHLTQRFFQPVDFALHLAEWLAIANHFADLAEGAFHPRSFYWQRS